MNKRLLFLSPIIIFIFLLSYPIKSEAAKKPSVELIYQNEAVTITWKKVKKADQYIIFKQNEDGKFKQLSTTSSLEFTDTDVVKNKRYKYKICSVENTIKSKKTACSVYTAPIDPKKKMIALTFDDGPGLYTKKIAKCLKKHDSRATFFVVGNRISTYKTDLTYAFDQGCEIGNHSYGHANYYYLNKKALKNDIKKTDKLIRNITGEPVKLLRTPGGANSKTISSAAGKPMFYWSIDSRDWECRNTNKIIKNVLNKVKDGDVILIHEIYGFSSEAIIKLIPKLKKKGYQLVTVSELAYYKGYDLKDGTLYYSFP